MTAITRTSAGQCAANLGDAPAAANAAPAAIARERLLADGGAFLRCDWTPALFVHFEADAAALRRVTPFELDLYHGRAFVSLVAFAMRHVSIAAVDGACNRSTSHADGLFLNTRTYVCHAGEPAIYFMHEWLDSAVQALLGPRTYGLPFHKADLTLTADADLRSCASHVAIGHIGGATPPAVLAMRARRAPDDDFAPAEADTLDHFLIERYTALTHRAGVSRRFRVTHEPWQIAPVSCSIDEDSLLHTTDFSSLALAGGFPGAISGTAPRPIAAHLTPGVSDVAIGRPSCVNGLGCLRVWSEILPAPY